MNEDAWIGGAGVISLTVALELSFYCLVCIYLFTPILHFQDVKNCRKLSGRYPGYEMNSDRLLLEC